MLKWAALTAGHTAEANVTTVSRRAAALPVTCPPRGRGYTDGGQQVRAESTAQIMKRSLGLNFIGVSDDSSNSSDIQLRGEKYD